jgi:hypothetical protein
MISRDSPAPAALLPKPSGKGGGPRSWEAGLYGLLAAVVAFAVTFPFVPFVSVVIVCTLGAGMSAGLAWFLFALQVDRSKFLRFTILNVGTAFFFMISPLPIWSLLVNIWTMADSGAETFLVGEGLAVGFLMIGVVIGAPLVLVICVIGTAMYCALRNLWILAWYGFA